MVLHSKRVEEGLIITNPVSLIGPIKIEICPHPVVFRDVWRIKAACDDTR